MNDLWPNAYLHTLNPFAIRITETFGIRWYGLAYLAGFFLGYLFIAWLAKRKLTPLPLDLASDFVFTVAVGTVVGGRLGYCIFYSPHLLTHISSSFPFWGVLAINEGGMASHGGILGIILACIYYARSHKLSPLALFDLTTIGGAIGIFFGRIANFVNGELLGRVAPPNYSWAVKFPQEIFSWPSSEPHRLESLVPVLQAGGKEVHSWHEAARFGGTDGMLNAIVEQVQNGNQAVQQALRPLLDGRYPSQLFEGAMEGALIFLVLLWIWRKPRKPGIIAGIFLTLYPVVRILGEQFRLPDAQIGYQALGLTRGQWLSIGMLAITATCLYLWSRRPGEKVGGWMISHENA